MKLFTGTGIKNGELPTKNFDYYSNTYLMVEYDGQCYIIADLFVPREYSERRDRDRFSQDLFNARCISAKSEYRFDDLFRELKAEEFKQYYSDIASYAHAIKRDLPIMVYTMFVLKLGKVL